jgi:hypothetical protein
MENVDGVLINQIIHNFEDISTSIKAGEQEFVGVALKETVKQGTGKGHANVLLCNLVLKSGLVEQIVTKHSLNIA